MKKLMFGLAAVLAGTVFATEGITSANVVGYAGSAPKVGAKGVGINFVNVSGAATKLGDLKVTGYTFEGEFDGQVYAEILDENGRVAKDESGENQLIYDWADWEENEGTELEPVMVRYTGWYDWNGDSADDTELALGDGLWIFSDSDTYQFQCAGQVCDQQVPVALNVGAKMCANPVPATITYKQITVSGYEASFEGEFDGEVYAEILDENGRVARDESGENQLIYDWADWEENEGTELEPEIVRYTGWYDWNGDPADDVTLGIGEALWVFADDAYDYTLTFPTAL